MRNWEKEIKIAIITDGSPKKQYEKILRLKIEDYLDEILISDEVAIKKPNPKMFDVFLDKVQCKPEEVIYVGDRLDRDVKPAKDAGLISVLIHRGTKYDPFVTKKESEITPDYHINDLYELWDIIKKLNTKDQII